MTARNNSGINTYIIGFDVETTGATKEAELLSVSFTVVSQETKEVVDQVLYVIEPESGAGTIDVVTDYTWETKCWDEFGSKYVDILNSVQNHPEAIRVPRTMIGKVIREYIDSWSVNTKCKLYVDNAAFDSLWLSNALRNSDHAVLEYQRKNIGSGTEYRYCGVNDYGNVVRTLTAIDESYKTLFGSVSVENDHDPRNDSHRHALFGAIIEDLKVSKK